MKVNLWYLHDCPFPPGKYTTAIARANAEWGRGPLYPGTVP